MLQLEEKKPPQQGRPSTVNNKQFLKLVSSRHIPHNSMPVVSNTVSVVFGEGLQRGSEPRSRPCMEPEEHTGYGDRRAVFLSEDRVSMMPTLLGYSLLILTM